MDDSELNSEPAHRDRHTALSDSASTSPSLLTVRDLRVHFPIRRSVFGRTTGWIKAVDGVSFDLPRGQTLALVGESGCGKSTTARALLRLVPAAGGQVVFHDDGRLVDVFALRRRALRAFRRHLQIVFQDPSGSLNPRLSVEASVSEPLAVHRLGHRRQRRERVVAMLERVGLTARDGERFPHELSGGQRQRVSLARALVSAPRLVVLDECVSALDVSVQAQILNLLVDLQHDLGLTYLFIAHYLAVVRQLGERIAVMYLGRIVELADRDELFAKAGHPYTQALLDSIPSLAPATSAPDRSRVRLRGDAPSPADLPSGCAFHPRCPFATEHCRTAPPPLEAKAGLRAGHVVACHHAERALQNR
jgi:oligopeptide transport system ATP-binding protein